MKNENNENMTTCDAHLAQEPGRDARDVGRERVAHLAQNRLGLAAPGVCAVGVRRNRVAHRRRAEHRAPHRRRRARPGEPA